MYFYCLFSFEYFDPYDHYAACWVILTFSLNVLTVVCVCGGGGGGSEVQVIAKLVWLTHLLCKFFMTHYVLLHILVYNFFFTHL